jgi:hypothetical protein
MSECEIRSRLQGRFPNAAVLADGLHRFVNEFPTYYLTEEQREVNFDRGAARVPIQRPEALDRFAPQDDLTIEIKIDAFTLTPINTRQHLRYMSLGHVTRHGALESGSGVSSWPSLQSVVIPDGWTILTEMFKDRGYEITPSDKAPLALGQRSLL